MLQKHWIHSTKGTNMNLPNTITLIRVILIPFFVNLMLYHYYQYALAVFLLACVTDALDGMIARLTNSKTELGAFLDPMADKLLIVSAFVTLVLMEMLPIWLVIIVVSRDIILALGSLVIYFTGHSMTIKPSILGKITTFMQLVVVVLSLVLISFDKHTAHIIGVYWATAGITVASGTQYVLRGMKLMA